MIKDKNISIKFYFTSGKVPIKNGKQKLFKDPKSQIKSVL
jgi:hypothetical protein